MMAGKHQYIWNGGEWVDVTGWKPPPRRTPYIIRDGMDAAQHPATGEIFESKSRFREVTRQHGLTEVGNDIPTIPTKPVLSRAERKRDIATAIEQLEQGYVPPPVESAAEWSAETGSETRMLDGA